MGFLEISSKRTSGPRRWEFVSEHNFRLARQNEAALRRTHSRARSKRHRRFETRSLAELSVSRYDEAILSLGLMVRFDELLFEGRSASVSLFNNF